MLPEILKQRIEEQISQIKLQELNKYSEELSDRYRHEKFIASQGHRLAYLAVRMPATFAAIFHVFSQIKKRISSLTVDSLLDLGAGPGTGMWALQEVFGTPRKVTLLENDKGLMQLGQALASSRFAAEWVQKDIGGNVSLEPHDAVLISYAIGEIPEEKWAPLIEKSWQAALQVLIIIEPGTPKGYARIRKIREALIGLNGHIIAPCPHEYECPIKGNDWCHFSERVARSAQHRMVKSGTLNYEDEKFSYVAVSKTPLTPMAGGRILRHPQKRSGHVHLRLCTEDGTIKERTVTRKDKEAYRRARDASWGDLSL